MTYLDGERPVTPCKPAAPYVGGKRLLAKRLVARIEIVAHATYAEPFVGMGGVFLSRRFAPAAEVVNDRSNEVATFFRILQRHYTAFLDMLRFQITSRAEFERLIACAPETLTDLERAARFLYLQRTAFGGKVAGRTFGVSPGNPGRFDTGKLSEILTAIHERVAGVTIESLDFADFITRYDRPDTLFYLDPPYHGSEDYYGAALFGPERFGELAAQLETIKGSFILTVNASPEMERVFAPFDCEKVALTYSVGGGDHAQKVTELIVSRVKAKREATLL